MFLTSGRSNNLASNANTYTPPSINTRDAKTAPAAVPTASNSSLPKRQQIPTDHRAYAAICKMASNRQQKVFKDLNPDARAAHEEYKTFLARQGWRPLDTSEKLGVEAEGYYGVAYYRTDTTGNIELVFAHRGTDFNERGNVLADLALAEGKEAEILQSADQYIKELIGRLSPGVKNKITKVTHTGFSLGGFIAGACCANHPLASEAVTFDAPGIGQLVSNETAATVGKKVINYVTVPNAVNTCNRHVGEVRMLLDIQQQEEKESVEFVFDPSGFAGDHITTGSDFFSKSYRPSPYKTQSQNNLGSFWHEANNTLSSHNLDKIIYATHYSPTYLWPTAKNTFIWKTENEFLQLSPHRSNRVSDGNLAATVLSGFADAYVSGTVWGYTARMDAKGELEGLASIQHQRLNKVFHSHAECVAYYQKLLLERDKAVRMIQEDEKTLSTAAQMEKGHIEIQKHFYRMPQRNRLEAAAKHTLLSVSHELWTKHVRECFRLEKGVTQAKLKLSSIEKLIEQFNEMVINPGYVTLTQTVAPPLRPVTAPQINPNAATANNQSRPQLGFRG